MTIERSCQELLLAVVRNSGDPGRISALAESVAEWDQLIDLALQHRVLPMLFSKLPDMERSVPASALARIRREYDRIVLHNLANAAELIAVLQTFDHAGIQAMPFKGVVLAASAYGDLLGRPGGDIDVLIRAQDLARASDLILQRGYELQPPAIVDGDFDGSERGEYEFIRRADGTVLELRWRLDLISNRFGRNLGMDWVWPHRRTIVLSGAEVPDLNPEISLLLLCMHGSKHSWSRLIWVCDVAKLLDSSPDLKWDQVLTEARHRGLKRPLGLGVLLAKRLTGAAIPPRILCRLDADKTVCRLADYFANNLLESPGMGPGGRVPYWAQLLDFQDRSRQFLSLHFLQPSDRDRVAFPLPDWLRPLYYLLRPLRLLWDRSAR